MRSKNERPYLYLSFWDVCLENFPVGIIYHTILSPEEAKNLITKAKKSKKLFCVASSEKSSDREKLCKALRTRWSMDISEKDFLHKWGTGTKIEIHPFPLHGVTIKEGDQLLVVSNNFALNKEHDENDKLHFRIIPESIKFHMFQYEKLML